MFIKGLSKLLGFARMGLSFIPGIGQLTNLMIGLGFALAQGLMTGNWKGALIQGLMEAVPLGLGKAMSAFHGTANELAGKMVDEVKDQISNAVKTIQNMNIPQAMKDIMIQGLNQFSKQISTQSFKNMLAQEIVSQANAHLPAGQAPITADSNMDTSFWKYQQDQGMVQALSNGIFKTQVNAAADANEQIYPQSYIDQIMKDPTNAKAIQGVTQQLQNEMTLRQQMGITDPEATRISVSGTTSSTGVPVGQNYGYSSASSYDGWRIDYSSIGNPPQPVNAAQLSGQPGTSGTFVVRRAQPEISV